MSLYRYFPTKGHLIRHIWEYVLANAAERARITSAEAENPVARLRSFVATFVQYWVEHRDHYWIVFSSRPSLSGPRSQDHLVDLQFDSQPIFDAISELLDALPASRRASPDQKRLLIELLLCKILGYLFGTIGQVMPRNCNHSLLKAHLLDDIVDQVLRFDAAAR